MVTLSLNFNTKKINFSLFASFPIGHKTPSTANRSRISCEAPLPAAEEPWYKYPLDHDDAYHRALEEAAVFFSASIYGWSFDYDIDERARRIPENFELTPLEEIPWGSGPFIAY